MQDNCTLNSNLRSNIKAIVAGNQTRQQLNDFVAACHAIASTAVSRKVGTASLQSRLHYECYSDLAYDCIADLFSQDDEGRLTKVAHYFEGVDLEGADDEELLAHLRRLICSRVNQELFRIYSDYDPSLGKILRNIKLAIHSLDNFVVSTRFGDLHIWPIMTDRNIRLLNIEPDVLERELCKSANGSETIPELLSKLSLYLRQQDLYSRSVPLLTVARVFRSIYTQGQAINDTTVIDDGFVISDSMALIKESCRSTKLEMQRKYVGKKKVTSECFEDYFTVIEQSMVQHFLGEDGDQGAFYEGLKALKPELTRVEYYRKHRAVVEYLARLTRERVGERLRKRA